ncbi:SCP-like protein, partial [Oesophagostomum dentatum]
MQAVPVWAVWLFAACFLLIIVVLLLDYCVIRRNALGNNCCTRARQKRNTANAVHQKRSTNMLLNILVSSTKDTVCPFQNPTPALQRSSMIYDHNLYRSRVAQGLAIHSGGRKLPRGSNIYKVEWNCRLEKLASDAVNDCLTKKMDNSIYGQNYEFIETADDYDLTNPYPLAMERWIAPALKKNFKDGAVTFRGDGDLQALANIIRSNTTLIGCSQKRCGAFAAVACFYNSPDIRQDELIYRKGEGCKLDSDCTAYADSYCEAESGLCSLSEVKSSTEAEPSSEVPRGYEDPEPVFVFQINGELMISDQG